MSSNEKGVAEVTTSAPNTAAPPAATTKPQDQASALPAQSNIEPPKVEYCAMCHKPITTKIVRAMAKSWHPEHFLCTHCKKPITETTFKEQEGRPYCMDDFCKLFAKKCKGCGEMILDARLNAMGETWHYDCFKCAECKTLIGLNEYYKRMGQPYCITCEMNRKPTPMKLKIERKK